MNQFVDAVIIHTQENPPQIQLLLLTVGCSSPFMRLAKRPATPHGTPRLVRSMPLLSLLVLFSLPSATPLQVCLETQKRRASIGVGSKKQEDGMVTPNSKQHKSLQPLRTEYDTIEG